MVTVIGVAGQKQNGKDELANYLAPRLVTLGRPWGRHAFAAEVKRIYCETFNVPRDFIEEWKENPEPPPGMLMSVRKGLQFIGDGFRQIQGDVWINLALRNPGEYQHKVISDARYTNEARAIKEVGGFTILIYRPGKLNEDPNGSESQIRPYVEFCASLGREGRISRWPEVQAAVQEQYGSEPLVFQSEWSTLRLDRAFFVNLSYIDFFIRNDGTLEDLHWKVDHLLLPCLEKEHGVGIHPGYNAGNWRDL